MRELLPSLMTNILTLRLKGTFCLVLLLSFNIQAQFSYQKHRSLVPPAGGFVPASIENIYAPSLTPKEMHHPVGDLERHLARKAVRARWWETWSVIWHERQ